MILKVKRNWYGLEFFLRKNRTKNLLHIFKKRENKTLKGVTGVIHIGANTGQERQLYASDGLFVIWIEPIDEVFEQLNFNLAGFQKQIAIKALVTDLDNAVYNFNIANNAGASSSILDLNLHKDIWPDVNFEKTVTLSSVTLPTLLNENKISLAKYNMLVMDTQGSELLILKGAVSILQNFKYIKTEAPDFESYVGCCQVNDLNLFLEPIGFREISRNRFAKHPRFGNYYDIIFKKVI